MAEEPLEKSQESAVRVRGGSFARNLPFIILSAFAILVGVFFYHVVKPLLMPLFLAAVAVLLLQPLYDRIKPHMPAWAAASFVTAGLFFVIIAPISTGVLIAVKDLGSLISELRGLATPETLRALASPEKTPLLAKGLAFVQSWAPIDPAEISAAAFDIIGGAGEAVYRNTMQIIGSLPWAILQIFIFAVATWFFLLDGDAIMDEWKAITPLREQDDALIRREFAVVCRGVVWGTLLAGIVQGLLLMLFLASIAAVSSEVHLGSWIVLLGLLTLIFAMIPFFGATAVWAPTAIWLILNGHTIEGVTLIILGAALISTSDNVVKVWVIKDAAKLHPLFVFICVFGGLKLLGILGVFVGPIIGAVLFAVVKVLRKESAALMTPVRADHHP